MGRRCESRRAEAVPSVDERDDYVRKVLAAFRTTPGTIGVVRRPDRLLAQQLFERGVPLRAVENALLLATVRRAARPAGPSPLPPVRSLAYFVPIIDEVLTADVAQDYYDHLRHTLARLVPQR